MPEGAQRTVHYVLELRGGTYEVRELRGDEGLSRPFRFELALRSDVLVAALEPENLIGDAAFIRLEREGEVLRRIRGMVSSASLEATAGSAAPELEVVIEAKLARTRMRTDMRIFRNKTVVQIVTEVLQKAFLEVESRLSDSYRERPYCVQFRESDYDFISRLLAEEGISYYFRDDWDGDFDTEVGTMVLVDQPSAYLPLASPRTIQFRPAKGLVRREEVIYELGRRACMSPKQVSLRDFNTDTPSLSLEVSVDGPSPAGQEYYDYPGYYQTEAEGQRLARIKSESMRCAAFQLHGASDCTRFYPGAVFDLEGCPDSIGEGEHVITMVRHDWAHPDRPYSNEFEAMANARLFRPEQRTLRPIAAGMLTGRITGPAGSEIHPDEMGRVKVYFPWDRLQDEDDDCSDWVPVVQDNTGHSLATPRVGWEVMVGFLEGNPDRPVVLGRTYNGADLPPEPLPAGKTRTTIKTLTSPYPSAGGGAGGGASTPALGLGATAGGDMTSPANEILVEDASGSELIRMQAQKDQNITIANDRTENVLNNETNQIQGTEDSTVGGNRDTVVAKDSQSNIKLSQILKVLGDRIRKVGADDSIQVLGLRSTVIGGMHIRRVATDDRTSVDALVEAIGAADIEMSLQKNTANASQYEAYLVGGVVLEATFKEKKEGTKGLRTETIGGALEVTTAKTYDLAVGGARSTTVLGSLEVSAQEPLELVASANADLVVGTGKFVADKIVFHSGGTALSLAGGVTSFTAPSLTFTASNIILGNSSVTFN